MRELKGLGELIFQRYLNTTHAPPPLDGVPLHIVQRGLNREPRFFGEEDNQAHLHRLGEALECAQLCQHGTSYLDL